MRISRLPFGGIAPLHRAIAANDLSAVHHALEHARGESRLAKWLTDLLLPPPLLLAIECANEEIIDALLAAGVDSQKEWRSLFPLGKASAAGRTQTVLTLLERKQDASMVIRALKIAAYGNHAGIVTILLDSGIDINLAIQNDRKPWLWHHMSDDVLRALIGGGLVAPRHVVEILESRPDPG